MLLGVIADDFTGASDIANTLAKSGMATRLLIGVPESAAPIPAFDAAVIALKSRSIPAAAAKSQSLAALAWLQTVGAQQLVFKYCSTFDSTPAGNIGPVAEALAAALGARGVICCPAFPATGRTVYQGHLFVGDRLLSQSGLEKHPLNPMTDPDLRRWLAQQCRGPVGLVHHRTVRQGPEAVRQALAQSGSVLVIADAIEDQDLVTLGQAAAGAPLITGGSGIAQGLADNFRAEGAVFASPEHFKGVAGPAVVLAGSCSAATRAQIVRHCEHNPSRAIDIDGLMAGTETARTLLAFAEAERHAMPLIYSSADPETVAAAQSQHGREPLAAAIENLFGELARGLVEAGFRRLVVAGGETSGAVVSALRLDAFDLGPEIDPGIPALAARHGSHGLALALKSGNFGGPDFFAKAVAKLDPATGNPPHPA